jgi:uncharacterized protein (TIGR03435 family)
VVSVKPNAPGDRRFDIRDQPGGRFLATGISLKMLLAYAYRVRDYQILGGPNWMSSDRWSVEAKAEESSFPLQTTATYMSTPDPLALRVQSLIDDQFQLKMHRETREFPVYELVSSKDGSKVQLSADQSPLVIQEQWLSSIYSLQLAMGGVPPAPLIQSGQTRPPSARGVISIGRSETGMLDFQAVAIPMANLIVTLSQYLTHTVVDKTGLRGLYDVRLQWSPEAESATTTMDPSGPSLFAAVQQQLGLRLVSTKGQVEVIVIDSAQKPGN